MSNWKEIISIKLDFLVNPAATHIAALTNELLLYLMRWRSTQQSSTAHKIENIIISQQHSREKYTVKVITIIQKHCMTWISTQFNLYVDLIYHILALVELAIASLILWHRHPLFIQLHHVCGMHLPVSHEENLSHRVK